MEFKVVEIPNEAKTTSTSPIVNAMMENIGKALELDLGERDANSYRKILRSSLNSRGFLKENLFRTKLSGPNVMLVWLEKKV